MIVREYGNATNGGEINIRKTVEREYGTALRGPGEEWKSIPVSQRRPYVKEGAAIRALLSPYGIYEILMGVNHGYHRPMLKLRIEYKGKSGPYATLNITNQAIGGIFGKKSRGELSRAMKNNGAVDLRTPTYGYLGATQLTYERIDFRHYNDWVIAI